METELEPAPLLVARLEQPAPRGREVPNLNAHLGLEAGVHSGEPGCRGDTLDESGIVDHSPVVNEDGERTAIPLDRGDGTRRAGFGQLDLLARTVHIRTSFGQPVGDP